MSCCNIKTLENVDPVRIGSLSYTSPWVWIRVIRTGEMFRVTTDDLCHTCAQVFYAKGSCFTHST